MNNIKDVQRRISVEEMPKSLPDFDSCECSKDFAIKNWIIDWITSSISKKLIKNNDLIPSKSEISKHLGVSVGTVQNAIRYVEDIGLLKSKQKIGTMISSVTNPINISPKSTSKREKAILAVKRYIIKKDIVINKTLPSTRKISEILGISQNTARLAYEFLCAEGIIASRQTRGNDSNWVLIKYPKLTPSEMVDTQVIKTDTLVEKIVNELKQYLADGFSIGDKIPSHDELAYDLNVSVKTIHDAVKILNREGVLLSRRGRYGTILASDPFNPSSDYLTENPIFADAIDASFYSYQKIENKIQNLIFKNYKAGDKLPSMKDLSIKFGVSTNTVRKALNSLSEQGYITFGRGRYGGTFIVDVPDDNEKQSYKWLSINRDVI